MKHVTIAAGAALSALLAATAFAQPPVNLRNLAPAAAPTPPPKALLPSAVGGAVVYVHDLEAMKHWYETMLGFSVRTTYARNNEVFEYIMGIGDSPAFMGLMKSSARPAGMNTNSRVVLPSPDPKALADHMAKQGVYVREAVPGSAYFLLDPEGNQVEVYRLSTPAPAPKR